MGETWKESLDHRVESELRGIQSRYDRRGKHSVKRWKKAFYLRAQIERESIYERIIRKRFSDMSSITVLEVGAGNGYNLFFFNGLGIPWGNMHANELLEDRLVELRRKLPADAIVLPGNALDIPATTRFDVVLASTIFSSILDVGFRQTLAEHLMELATTRGIILWYDFVYNNPWNKDVRGIPRHEIRQLFNKAKAIRFRTTTLAPPIGRLVGRFYRQFSWIPFLRSHVVAEIELDNKRSGSCSGDVSAGTA